MRYLQSVVLLLIGFTFIVSCADSPTDSSDGATGQILMQAFDAPLTMDADHVYLDIERVSVHKAGEDTTGGWMKIAEPDTTYDFLELVNGAKTVLADTTLATGHYTQMRLLLGTDNSIVVDGVSHSLFVPSGTQTGVKLNLDFEIEPDEMTEIYVDFNAAKSIHYARGRGDYIMRPTFRAFKRVVSGTISGAVSDTAGSPVENAAVHAVDADDDTTSTLTDTLGSYMLIVPEGTYQVGAEAENYASSDTTYSGIEVEAMDELSGYDFTMME